MRTVPIHNLRPNEADWTPPVIVTFDTETRQVIDGTSEVHYLRCWVARLDVRRDRRKSVTWRSTDEGTLAADLAAVLASWNARHPTLWVYAHNLAFDLTTSEVTMHLSDHGYSVSEFAVDSPSPFIKMTNGRGRITFADSYSWLPTSLHEVAVSMGTDKIPLPDNDAELEYWLARCRVDVDILSEAMLTIMNWWDANHLGHWSITGSASGWNVMRHKADVQRITINPSKEGIDSDRSAIYGGRRGLWRSGRQPGGRYAEMDFTAAYPTIAQHLALPVERMSKFASLPVDHRWLSSDRHGVIARCRIQTGTPLWPARAGGRVWYPTGDFWTDLAGPDIAEAASRGCLAAVGAGWVHRLGLVLKPWAEWCLAASRGDDPSVPPVVRMWAKHCGRAVIGKWAQRAFETIELGPSPCNGWSAEEGWNHTSGTRAVIIDLDGRRWQASASGEGDNCYPAVLAYVEAYTRVRLGRMIESMPTGAIVSCDTDGTMVDLNALNTWDATWADLWPLVPRIKREYGVIEMIGPQHMVLDSKRRMAGIPASAVPDEHGDLAALLWPKMLWQMGNGQAGAYVRPTQEYRLAATYAPGWVTDDGQVIPIEMSVGADGENKIVAWPETSHYASGITLAEHQNKDLERYRDDSTQTRHRQDKAQQA